MAVLAAGGPAAAELPPQECHDAGFGGYDVLWHDGGFVLYPGRYSHDDYRLVLEDCAGNRALTIVRAYDKPALQDNWDDSEALHAAIDAALTSKRAYTMAQIGDIARKHGAKATIGAMGYESCACEKYGQ